MHNSNNFTNVSPVMFAEYVFVIIYVVYWALCLYFQNELYCTIYLISVSDYDNDNNYICSTRPSAHNTNICYTTIMSDVICIDIDVGKGVCTYC